MHLMPKDALGYLRVPHSSKRPHLVEELRGRHVEQQLAKRLDFLDVGGMLMYMSVEYLFTFAQKSSS